MSQQSEPIDDSRGKQHRELDRLERRHLWLSVLLPFTFILAIVIAIVGTVLSLRSPVQVAVVSDSMLTILVLCPLVVCMFPLVILSLVLVSLLGRWHPKSRSPLRRLEAWTATMEQNIESWLGHVDERVLNWAVRLAPFQHLLTAFDPPTAENNDEGEE